MRTPIHREERKREIMEKSFAAYSETGLNDTGAKGLAKACGMTAPNFYAYFDSIEQLIIECTAYNISKIEAEFISKFPKKAEDLNKFIDNIPKWALDKYGKAFRFIYQVYASPRFREYGKQYIRGLKDRYVLYCKDLAPKFGIDEEKLLPIFSLFVRTSIQYALFEDKESLDAQMAIVRAAVEAAK